MYDGNANVAIAYLYNFTGLKIKYSALISFIFFVKVRVDSFDSFTLSFCITVLLKFASPN